ncbi:MAG TPA: M56 family metallopeptidase [Patescibacteria group bacterium]|nr:M56 family metallopeptidase [Patescibacteria group bacterium]
MNAASALGLDSVGLRYLLEPAARTLILAGAVWLLLAAFRVREVSLRLATWTIILYAALAMPFLSRIVPEVPLPVLSPQSAQQAESDLASLKAATSASVAQFAVFDPATARPAETRQAAGAGPVSMNEKTGEAVRAFLPAVIILLYLLVTAILLGRFVLGWASGRRLRRTGEPLADERLLGLLARETRKAGLKKLPQLAESAALSVPATLGLLRPAILLPLEWSRWNESQMNAVLAHELSHIARRDGLTQMLSRIHRALFWFSPLSWLLDHTLVELAEQASDDAALRSGADRIRYAEVLLHFFRALKAARGRVRWEGVSMAQGSRSERRVERILGNSPLSRGLGLAPLATVALAVAPLICLAAAVRPSRADAIPAPLPAAPSPPPLALNPPSLPAPSASADALPAARRVPVKLRRHGPGRQSRRRTPGSFLWFRKNGRVYVVSDPATVKAALGALAPLENIEQQLAVLDSEQGTLVRDQIDLAAGLAGAGSQARDGWAQWREFEMQLRAIESAATPEELGLAEAEFAQAEWNAMQNRMVRLEFADRQQASLDQQQAALDRQRVELERQQAQLAIQAEAFSRALIDRSFQGGLARPL